MKHNSVFFQSIKIILSMTMAAVILCCSICSAAAEVEILEFDDEDFRNGNFDNSDYVPKGDRVIVSLGDSYSAGEGIEKFYSQDRSLRDRINDQDWRGHRSENSWPGQLRLNGVEGEMRDEKNRNSRWFFVASTGATTNDYFNNQEYEFIRPTADMLQFSDASINWLFPTFSSVKRQQDPQQDVFGRDELNDKTIDYVTMTMGGNDAGFSDVVTDAVIRNDFLFPNLLSDKLNDTWDHFYSKGKYKNKKGIRDDLISVYKDINEKTNGNKNTNNKTKIIIVGYPQLFSKNGSALQMIDEKEAKYVDHHVHLFNYAIQNAVIECQRENIPIYFVTVEDMFEGHAAYDSEPYINGIMPLQLQDHKLSFPFVSQYSIHPNKTGAEKYAERVNVVLKYLDSKQAPRKVDPKYKQVDDPGERDVVLVLDTSGSRQGDPIDNTKTAAQQFVDSVNESEANVGLVTYNNSASKICDFTLDGNKLYSAINEIGTGGRTNIYDGLKNAKEMLDSRTTANSKKIIVLMSDGMANEGKTGESLIEYAKSLKDEGVYIYTLGFFDSLKGSDKAECQYIMERIATSGCHYEVTNPESLVFFFGDIADQINGQKYIYIRIACPVDVTVTHDGETLNSSQSVLSTRTSFGTLTFEDTDTAGRSSVSTSSYSSSSGDISPGDEDRVKILRLKEGENYDVRINGTGDGTMNYKIGFMDEKGEYNDFREFENVEISPKTQINTLATVSDTTVMNVDNDGDGKYDITYEANANSVGKISQRGELKGSPVAVAFIIVLIVFVLLAGTVIFLKIWRERKGIKSK